MAQCEAKNAKGEQCGRHANRGAVYCQFHLKRLSQGVTHGLTASRKVLGIPETYHDVYQEFYESDAPTDLRRELALARTVFVEVRDALLSGDKRDECAVKIVGALREHLGDDVPPGLFDQYAVSLVEAIVPILKPYMPLTNMKLEVAKDLTKILGDVAAIAMKMKKIQDGLVLKVEVNQQVLVQFVQQVIYPVITDSSQRQAIAERASQFALRRTNQPEEARPSGPLSRAEQAPDIMQHL